jgi:hypothetical protein
MDNKNVILVLFFLIISVCVTAQQRQIVVLKNETVLARYKVGDVISFAREGDKEISQQKILDLNDTLIMMNLDSVSYFRIKKLDIRGRKASTLGQRLGAYMIAAGVILPLAELINTGWVQDDKDASISQGVGIASVALVTTGAALVFIKKPYFKPGRKHRILIVKRGSVFYEGDTPVRSPNPYLPRN